LPRISFKNGKRRLRALYVGDTKKQDKVQLFFTLMAMIENLVNENQLKDANHKIVINEKVAIDNLGDRNVGLCDFNVIVCSRGVYLQNKKHFDLVAESRRVIVFANEVVKDPRPHKDIVFVSIKDGIIKPIKGEIDFLVDA